MQTAVMQMSNSVDAAPLVEAKAEPLLGPAVHSPMSAMVSHPVPVSFAVHPESERESVAQ